MKYNFWWLAGALAGIAIVMIVFLIKRAARGPSSDFDERQTAARGRAYQYAFFTTALAELIYVCLEAAGISFADASAGPLLGVLCGVAVFTVTAIFMDAYVSLRESTRSTVFLSVIMIVLQLLIGIPKLLDGKAVVDGRLTFDAINLIIAALFAVVLAAVVIHWLQGRRAEQSERSGGDE